MRELKTVKETFIRLEKLHNMSLPIQRKLSAYFRLQKIKNLKLFNKILKQSIGSQDQRPLSFVDGARMSRSGVTIRTWKDLDINRSLMKRKICEDSYSTKIPGCPQKLQLLKLDCIIRLYGFL